LHFSLPPKNAVLLCKKSCPAVAGQLSFLCAQAHKEFLQQAARAWHSEQKVEKHSLLLDYLL
jgi:hypothetical protein